MKRICFYHAGCPDGFSAAWAVRQAWGKSGTYVARGHNDDPQLARCTDAIVAYVDIAPTNEELRKLIDTTEQIIVLDHHLSSRDRFARDPDLARSLEAQGHFIQFEMGHSGAVLAWQYFSPDRPAPDLLLYVQDQDLWSWELPRSREVNLAIGSYPLRFDTWDELAARPWPELANEGEPLLRAQRVQVEHVLTQAGPLCVGGQRVEGVNASEHRSQVGHALAERARFDAPWGCVYRIERGKVHATLYSIGDFDVARIAAGYGGGGHRNAAGFSLDLGDWTKEVV